MPRPTLTLSSPDMLVAAIPYLIGHDPGDCLIVVLTGRHREVLAAARIDWPENADLETWAQGIAVACTNAGNSTAAACLLVALIDKTGTPAGIAAAEAASMALAGAGIHPTDTLIVSAGSWRRAPWLTGAGPATPVHADASRTMERALGSAPAQTREELLQRFTQDEDTAAKVALLLDAEAGEDTETAGELAGKVVTALTRKGRAWTQDDTVRLLRALRRVQVRDIVVYSLVCCTGEQACRARNILDEVVRAAPFRWRAPVATLDAVCHYMAGDGLAMRALLGEALRDDSDYTLAQLLTECYALGVSPERWTAVVQGMPEPWNGTP